MFQSLHDHHQAFYESSQEKLATCWDPNYVYI